MAPRSSEQFEEIREERKHQISDVALKLFSVKTYANTSISDIAKEAGISKGLMYNYFSSKEELLMYILETGIDKVLNIFDPNHDGVLETHEMEYFLNESFKMLKEHHEFWAIYFQVSMQPEVFKHIEKKIEELYKQFYALLLPYFTKLGFENPEAEIILFGALMDGIAMDYAMKPDMFPLDMIQKEIIKKYCTKQK
jgi:AcrR family transcriptional regulator